MHQAQGKAGGRVNQMPGHMSVQALQVRVDGQAEVRSREVQVGNDSAKFRTGGGALQLLK